MKYFFTLNILFLFLLLGCNNDKPQPKDIDGDSVNTETVQSENTEQQETEQSDQNNTSDLKSNTETGGENTSSQKADQNSSSDKDYSGEVIPAKELQSFFPKKYKDYETEKSSTGQSNSGTNLSSLAGMNYVKGDTLIYARITDYGSKENNPDIERLKNVAEDNDKFENFKIEGENFYGFSYWNLLRPEGHITVNYLGRFNIYAEIAYETALKGNEKEFIEQFKLEKLKDKIVE